MSVKYVFKKGELIEFETGEYSDYQTHYPMRVINRFNIREQLSTYIEKNNIERDDYSNDHQEFVAYLVANGFIEEPDEQIVFRVWIGAYNCFADPKMIGA